MLLVDAAAEYHSYGDSADKDNTRDMLLKTDEQHIQAQYHRILEDTCLESVHILAVALHAVGKKDDERQLRHLGGL